MMFQVMTTAYLVFVSRATTVDGFIMMMTMTRRRIPLLSIRQQANGPCQPKMMKMMTNSRNSDCIKPQLQHGVLQHVHVHGAPPSEWKQGATGTSSADDDNNDDVTSNHPLRPASSSRRSGIIRTAMSTSNDTLKKSIVVSAKASIAAGLLLAAWSFGTPLSQIATTTTTTPSSILPTSTPLKPAVTVANAVEERNELLCGTGFFTNIYQYKCTEIGDIEKEGISRDLSSEELSSVSSLMEKLELGSTSSSGSGSGEGESSAAATTTKTNEK